MTCSLNQSKLKRNFSPERTNSKRQNNKEEEEEEEEEVKEEVKEKEREEEQQLIMLNQLAPENLNTDTSLMRSLPSFQEQAQLYKSSQSTRMIKSQTWFLIHHRWFQTWASACSISDHIGSSYSNPTEALNSSNTIDPILKPEQIPPIDNADLLQSSDQLKFPISIGIDFQVVPEAFWNLLVKWYGLKSDSHSIPRRVIAPGGPGSESIQFYPPKFYFYFLVKSHIGQTEIDPTEKDLILSATNVERLERRFSIDHSLLELKNQVAHHLVTKNDPPQPILTRPFRLWHLEHPPFDMDAFLVPLYVFYQIEARLIQPDSGDQADLNEAFLTDPDNIMAIEQQDSLGQWLIDPDQLAAKRIELFAPPSLSSGPSTNALGGQAWLDQMEEMNKSNARDPKFLLTSPTTAEPTSQLHPNPTTATGSDFLSQMQLATQLGPHSSSQPTSLKQRGVRGLVGLSNLGNTCFMNSALQCLSNCPELKTYFLSRVYVSELNRTNPLGMGGKVAESFGQLIERMWSSEFQVLNAISSTSSGGPSVFRSVSPREFKSIVGRFNSLFLGYGQQDSQELLTFLLDALHEDLNRVKIKPFDEIPDYDDSPSDSNHPLEESEKILNLAKTCWKLYRRRNDSVIVDLFQGQYKSTLICPDCNKVAIKFDEIMYLTLQLPISKKIKGSIYFVPLDPSKPRVKITYLMNKDSTIRQLKQHLGQILQLDCENMAVIEDWSGKPWKIWQDTDLIDGILDRDVINIFETPLPFATLKSRVYYSDLESADLLIPVVSYRQGERSITVHGNSVKPSRITFGIFFVVRISAKDRLSYRSVYNAIVREYARYTTRADDLFEATGNEDVEMSDGLAGEGEKETSVPERQAVANLFKIFVPRTPYATVFPTSNLMENITISLEERIELSAPQPKVTTPATSPPLPDGDSSMSSSNEAAFETEEAEDLYQTNSHETQLTEIHPVSLNPLVHKGDYFECEWNPSSVAHFFGNDRLLSNSKNWINPPIIEDPDFIASKTEQNKKQGGITIEDCFKDFSKPEKLGAADKWYCPRCKNHVQATKQMQIWKVPDILVVHFKRFSSARTSYGRSTKVDAYVDFPIEGLDLSDQVESVRVMRDLKCRKKKLVREEKKKDLSQQDPSLSSLEESKAKEKKQEILETEFEIRNNDHDIDQNDHDIDQNDQECYRSDADTKNNHINDKDEDGEKVETDEEDESLIYDLFAVDNHFGGLGGGHYTAFAKNEEDGKWHNYDDSHVTEVSSPEQVKSSAAYLLFYRRRTNRKLGLKTHGIVSSAMQSRDISVAPSEERMPSSESIVDKMKESSVDGQENDSSLNESKRFSDRGGDELSEEIENGDAEEDGIDSSAGVDRVSCPSDQCNSSSSRSENNQDADEDETSSLINNLGDSSSVCSRKSVSADDDLIQDDHLEFENYSDQVLQLHDVSESVPDLETPSRNDIPSPLPPPPYKPSI